MLDLLVRPYLHYFDFNGRSRRAEFLLFSLLNVAIAIIVKNMLAGLGAIDAAGELGSGADSGLVLAVFCVWFLLGTLPLVALAVRRAHDRGKSGWILLVALIPYIGPLILMFQMLGVGNGGMNQYGPDPRR